MTTTAARSLPVLPLHTGVVGPGMVVTIALETAEARAAADAAMGAGRRILLVPKLDGRYARVGTVAAIEDSGRGAILVRGIERAVLGAAVVGDRDDQALWLEVEPVAEAAPPSDEAKALAREFKAVVEQILDRRGAARIAEGLRSIREPSLVADTAFWSPDLTAEQKVEILETIDVEQRLRLVLAWARDTLADLVVREEVAASVHEGLEKQQREQLLRRQLAAIREELGEDSPASDTDYRARLEASGAPEHVRAAVERELDKLERTSEQSPEHSWIVSWLDTVLDIPWGTRAPESYDLDAAQAVLDADHAGMQDVKERIIEALAVRKLRAERDTEARGTDSRSTGSGRGSGTILALIGPPGVGKTSLGESIARALGRPFARVALGGVRDEAEVRGHRRTYVGARAGRFVRALTEAGAMNPVLLLDEVDKVGSDWRGDPSSALLEVLDPAQNHTFRDHYLEVDLDLSEVVFLATANVLDTIPGPLLDRMEVVRLDGYTADEKVDIARNHLLPRLLERTAIRDDEVIVHDEALREVVHGYTREAGVRELERQLGRILRKVAARVAGGDVPIVVDVAMVATLLGRRRFRDEPAARTAVPGVATGLAVTGIGGDVLYVEATAMDGEPGLTLTGQLGDVMKESAEIARSFIRSRAVELGVDPSSLETRRVHVHFPAGAVPKDGPSAGVTMTTALVSLLSGRTVRADTGMTGEITLQGLVLPIGGVKQKVLAAHRAGLTHVILPAGNEGDLDDVPEHVRGAMRFTLADDVRDVLAAALE